MPDKLTNNSGIRQPDEAAGIVRFYKIGGVCFRVESPFFRETPELAEFSVPEGEPDVRFQVRLADGIGDPCLGRMNGFRRKPDETVYPDGTRVFSNEYTGGVLMTERLRADGIREVLYSSTATALSTRVVLRILDLPMQMIRFGGIFLHASWILIDGRGILFTAPMQTGKSTQAALWERYRGAEIVNGDRAILRRSSGKWSVYGSPYCGTSRICKNRSAQPAAIVILSQAPENRVRRASVRETLAALLEGCSYDPGDPEQMTMVMDVLQSMIAEIPAYCLACTPDEDAVKTLEDALWRK